MAAREVLQRELEHHEELYSSHAQQLFARERVRLFWRHVVAAC